MNTMHKRMTISNLITNLNVSNSTAHSFNEKTDRKSFIFIFYAISTIVNIILTNYVIFKMNKILIQTENKEILLYLILYVGQWAICAILSLAFYSVFYLWHLISIESEFPKFSKHFNNLFRFFIAIMTVLFLAAGIYLLSKLSTKDSKEYQLNFHESYLLLYIFLSVDLFISSLITLLAIYYFVMICLRLKTEKLEINDEFIQNIKDDLFLKHNPKSSTIMIPSEEFIKNNIFLEEQIKQIKYMKNSPEYIQKKVSHLKNDSNGSNSKIKNQILNFAFGNEKKKDNLLDEIKKQIETTASDK